MANDLIRLIVFGDLSGQRRLVLGRSPKFFESERDCPNLLQPGISHDTE